jgi:nucleoid-associated protein YgaU
MALAKLTILVETGPATFVPAIVALFNPNQIAVQKTANWRLVPTAERDVPRSQFTHGEPAVLTMDLFFDTYEARADVRVHTLPIFHLTTVERHGDIHRPPVCQLAWGQFGVFFQGVLQSLNQRFTLFLADGTPVRATLGCTFREWRSDAEEARLLKKESVDVAKTRTVRRGETLSGIAGEEYHDPTLWRPIAEANRIDNPRALQPGQVLAIPALRPSRPVERR